MVARCRCSASRRPRQAAISTSRAFLRQELDRSRAALGEDDHSFALEIAGDALAPYRDGDVILVSPGTPIRKGDRVVVKTRAGEMLVKALKRRTAKLLELQSLDGAQNERTLAVADVAWIARIVWASQ